LLLCERLGRIALRLRVARRALHEYPNDDAGQGTEPLTINPSGAIAGFVVDPVRECPEVRGLLNELRLWICRPISLLSTRGPSRPSAWHANHASGSNA